MITLNSKEYPIKFSLNTKRLFCREKGIDLPEFTEMFAGVAEMRLDDIENLALFILTALREGARKEGTTCDIVIDDIVEMFSDDPQMTEKILTAYAEAEVRGSEDKGKDKARS